MAKVCAAERCDKTFVATNPRKTYCSPACKQWQTKKIGGVNGPRKKPTAEQQHKWNVQAKYGIAYDEWVSLLEAQGGVCAICKRGESQGRRLSTDHDHDTGLVRGLLCSDCNRGIGLLKDSPDVVASALQYLNERKGEAA